jgi:ornithine carbamoyltransferase
MKARDLVTDRDLSRDDLDEILDLAGRIKAGPAGWRAALQDRTLALIFEKPSLRTRVSFEAGMTQLGGHAIDLGQSVAMGKRESIADVARTLSGMVDGIMARTFSQEAVAELARYATVPVINGLSDHLHPCQALADYLTVRERHGRIAGIRLAYVGDGNNVAHSLMLTGARLGVHVRVATPPGYAPDPAVVAAAAGDAQPHGGSIQVGTDTAAAVAGADVIYTDTWASMGQEAEHAGRVKVFRPFQVNREVVGRAAAGAIFLHCLPAHRGEEVTDEVIESPASAVFQQAANRLHAQKALLVLLLGAGAGAA